MKFKNPRFWGLVAKPGRPLVIFLSALPFVLCVILYVTASNIRHAANPQDKILPTFARMGSAVKRMAFEKDPNTGEYLLWEDTGASLKRIFIGVIFASVFGLFIGINMGLFPGFESLTAVFMRVISIIPPLAILPILFITFGVDELGKVMLIFLGTFPFICRDIYLYSRQTPHEQITKSLTLGAGQLRTVYSVIMPQIMPRLINTTRLSFGAAWLFLIASEAIASTSGLGYRIFLVRRYLAMDVIIPYVVWITLLGFITDWCLKKFLAWKYPWYVKKEF